MLNKHNPCVDAMECKAVRSEFPAKHRHSSCIVIDKCGCRTGRESSTQCHAVAKQPSCELTAMAAYKQAQSEPKRLACAGQPHDEELIDCLDKYLCCRELTTAHQLLIIA